jgi:hypothetical protein
LGRYTDNFLPLANINATIEIPVTVTVTRPRMDGSTPAHTLEIPSWYAPIAATTLNVCELILACRSLTTQMMTVSDLTVSHVVGVSIVTVDSNLKLEVAASSQSSSTVTRILV